MSVNEMSFEQAATLLAEIVSQATGQKVLTPIDNDGFVAVGQLALKTGYDPLTTAISQVLGRTIFSTRPYSAKFKGLFVSNQKWGAVTRKINYVDGKLEDDSRFTLTNGQSVDQQKVNKPEVVQTNFYGAEMFQRHVTIYKDQLDCAFQNAAEFSQFISGVIQNVNDQLEQCHEAMSRQCLCNFIVGKAAGDSSNVIHLVSTYNEQTGSSLTAESVMAPDNFVPFTKWLYGYIQSLASLMGERGTKYHINITGKPIMRHTPRDRMKCYMNTQILNNMDTSVLSGIFQADKMRMIDYEEVNYWQSIDSPTGVNATATYLAPDGTLTTTPEAVAVPHVLGIMFDEEAMGVTTMSTWTASAPFNAAGGYQNTFWHFTDRIWNDFTENGVVLCMD